MDRILASPRRQADAEAMLDRDQFPFSRLNRFDFDRTPSLCQKARASLIRVAARVAATPAAGGSDRAALDEAEEARQGMEWLVGMDCSCDEPAKTFEDIARAHGADSFTLGEFAELSDPAKLGLRRHKDPGIRTTAP